MLDELTLKTGAFEVGEGDPMPGSHFVYKVRPEESGGRFALLQGGLRPRMLVDPHVHTREDEMSIVLRGALGARVGDDEYLLHPGAVLLKPRNVVHAMWNPSDEPNVVLEYITPGAYVAFFEEVSALGGWDSGLDLDAVAAKYGQRWVRDADWLADVIARHGLESR